MNGKGKSRPRLCAPWPAILVGLISAAAILAMPPAGAAEGKREPAEKATDAPKAEREKPAASGEAKEATKPADLAPRIAKLISQLGSKDYRQREQAEQALVKIGAPATAALKLASADKDAERARRAKKALATIQKSLQQVRRERRDKGRRGEGDRGAAAERLAKGLPKELAGRAKAILKARERAIALANSRAAKALLELAKRMDKAGKRRASVRLCRMVLRIEPANKEATAALRKAGVELEGQPRREGDREGAARVGPRDGEGPPKPGPRDGEAPRKPGPRDGEGPRKPGPREG